MAENTFEGMKLLGVPLDRRSYGSIIMAYMRAGMLNQGESLLKEMEAEDIYAGREVYKALLRASSMNGDRKGAQRVFDAIQLAGIIPDAKFCGLLINAYVVAGQSSEARSAFENLKRSGLEPNDKCIALVLAAYEKENKLKKGTGLSDRTGKGWFSAWKRSFRDTGSLVSKTGGGEVELMSRDYALSKD